MPRKDMILGFFGEYRFLSNFHICPITIEGRTFNSSEAAYMSFKTECPVWKDKFAELTDPADAKKLGRQVPLRPDWDKYRLAAMDIVLTEKFKSNPLRQMLLDTEDMYLEETNTWGDTFWGVCNGVGENNLGKCLMNIRNDLRFQDKLKGSDFEI